MLTTEQKRLVCLLHNAIALDSLFEISPISRLNMNAEVKASSYQSFEMQMLHAHLQNFISENFSSYEEGIQLADSIHRQLVGDLKYRSRTVLRETIMDCIVKLMGPTPKYETELDKFIFGYSIHIRSMKTKQKIGDWIASKDRTLFFIWDMF